MLTYLAVDVLPLYNNNNGWTTAELVAWLVMNATTSGLIQVFPDSVLSMASIYSGHHIDHTHTIPNPALSFYS